MKVEYVEEKVIYGVSLRTCNEAEIDPALGKIPGLWQTFDNAVHVDYVNGNRVYGVYYQYESDDAGDFSVLAGTDQPDCLSSLPLERVTIREGRYLVFHGKGTMPQVVLETWGRIWTYFAKGETEYMRGYATDFEYYLSDKEIKIYISVLG